MTRGHLSAGPTLPLGQHGPQVGGRNTVQSVALDPCRQPAGVRGQTCDAQRVRRRVGVGVDPVRGPAQQRRRTRGITPLHMGETDGELRQALPQLTLLPRGRLPHPFEHLMRVERIPMVDQLLGLAQRLVRAQHDILGHPLDPLRTMGQRAAQCVARAGIASPPLRVPVAAAHVSMMAGFQDGW